MKKRYLAFYSILIFCIIPQDYQDLNANTPCTNCTNNVINDKVNQKNILELEVPTFQMYDFIPPKYIIIKGQILFEDNWIAHYIPSLYYTHLNLRIYLDNKILSQTDFTPNSSSTGKYTWRIYFPTKTLSVAFLNKIQKKQNDIRVYLYYKNNPIIKVY